MTGNCFSGHVIDESLALGNLEGVAFTATILLRACVCTGYSVSYYRSERTSSAYLL